LFFSGAARAHVQRHGSWFVTDQALADLPAAAPLKNKRLVKDLSGYKQATPTGFGAKSPDPLKH